jgi:predicted PurR-regulated permease PerM
MQDNDYFNKYSAIVIIGGLSVLAFFLVRPIMISLVIALILSLALYPPYKWLTKKTGMRNFSALIICVSLFLLVLIPIWFLLPTLLDQSVKIYLDLQTLDFRALFSQVIPSIFPNSNSITEMAPIFSSFVNSSGNYILNQLSNAIFNLPMILIKVLLIFFVLFFVLRDGELLLMYLKEMLPFPKEIKNKIFNQSRDLTISVLYGQILMGIIQGMIAGLGFWIFGVPNSLVLTLLAMLAGILPIIGTTVIWIPTTIYLIFIGNIFGAVGVAIFGLISTGVENFVRPIIVSYRVELHPAFVIVGMIGGLLYWGFLGILIGPLILAYLVIILELYRKKKSGVFIKIPSDIE